MIESIAEAFATFVKRQSGFFRTSTRDNTAVARRYLHGLAQAEDCTFESTAAVVDAGCAQQFRLFISNLPWDHEPVVAQIGVDADRLLGGKPGSSLLIDESGFPKQGKHSVAVARQWSGRLGKVNNCQGLPRGDGGVRRADGRRTLHADRHAALPAQTLDRRPPHDARRPDTASRPQADVQK